MSLKSHLKQTAIAGLIVAVTAPTAFAEDVLFWSRQGGQVEEIQAIRESVLPGASVSMDFQSPDSGPWFTRLEAELEAGDGTIGLLGALHGDLSSLDPEGLVDLSGLDLGDVTPAPAFMELGKLGTDQQLYLPWMQATYVMAANKDALQYLPEGADVMSLSYDELIEWAKNMQAVDGTPRFGFPAGPNGLKHRFFQGYLYPSFTDSMVTEFRSEAAVEAWETFAELWEYTNPASTSYDFMQDPLLAGDVWVAFDHTARIGDALNDESGNFIAFPAPAGPTGRGFMPVLAGLAIPTTAPDMDASKAALTHMMQRDTQLNMLAAVNFFPTVDAEVGEGSTMAAQLSGAAISAMANAPDANPGLLPVGLGDLGGQFNAVYVDTFERIILSGQPIQDVLDDQAETLREIMIDADAPCWAPDAASEGPCPVN